MKVLLVTGRMAEGMVRRYAKEIEGIEVDVRVMPVAVAALMGTRYIARRLRGVSGYDMIMIPGMAMGDASIIEKEIGIPTFKGPRHAKDIPWIVERMDEIELSKTLPADDLLQARLRERAEAELERIERDADRLVKRGGNFRIGSLALGPSFPCRILAEIVNAPMLGECELVRRARYYLRSGADMIDVGMISNDPRPEDAYRMVKLLKSELKVPVSIDTLDVDEARMGIKAGADLLLSLDARNIEDLFRDAKGIYSVVLPIDERGEIPKDPIERIKVLEGNVSKARELGMERLIADPILDPPIEPGLARSIVSYHLFRSRHKDAPMLMGIGNVTELTDADTPGMTALLAGIATELGISLVLSTEVSDRARGHISELSKAVKMMFLAKIGRSAPKNLGIDLMVLRDRRLLDLPYDEGIEKGARVLRAKGRKGYRHDPMGIFRIFVDRDRGELIAAHYRHGSDLPDVVIRGREPGSIISEMVSEGLVSDLAHSSYLGMELEKAYIALKTGKSYVQDEELY